MARLDPESSTKHPRPSGSMRRRTSPPRSSSTSTAATSSRSACWRTSTTPRRSACTCSSSPRSTAVWAAAPTTSIASPRSWPRSTWASPPACWPPSWAPTRSPSAARRSRRRSGWAASPRRAACRLRRHRAAGRQRPGGAGAPRPCRSSRTATVAGYQITGRKQWISNGGVAELYTILALAPGGPSWFIVERGTPRASPRASPRTSTASAPATRPPLFLEDVFVPADRLVGGVEGQGLAQAQAVFGYTRLMVAAFGLGARLGRAHSAPSATRSSASRPARRSARSRATRTS